MFRQIATASAFILRDIVARLAPRLKLALDGFAL